MHGLTSVEQRAFDGLLDPPRGVRRKSCALGRIKSLRRTNQPNIALFDQVRQRHATVVVVLADRNHEAKVGSDQTVLGLMATIVDDGPSELSFLERCQKIGATNLLQVVLEFSMASGHAGPRRIL